MCSHTIASPPSDFRYIVTIEDENGCKATDDVAILFNPLVYVPNTFTPNDDEFNRIFKAKGGNIKNFNLKIYNRWGELIFESDDINIGWDGTYKGEYFQDGTYTSKIRYEDSRGNESKLVGHVNLLR